MKSWKSLKEAGKTSSLSPLRYPGGKRRFLKHLGKSLSKCPHQIETLIEPFAGGASVSIACLEQELVENVVIGDRDELVSGFWKVVFSEAHTELIELVQKTPVDIDTWKHLKDLKPESDLERAFTCLFLNRTSFSGILNRTAGPIGGKAQTGQYDIDCRFNKEAIVQRIENLAKLRDRVLIVNQGGYSSTYEWVKENTEITSSSHKYLWYFDPPFFHKASKLYRHYFESQDHIEFKRFIFNDLEGNWLLSYDDVLAARTLYSKCPGYSVVSDTYSASCSKQSTRTPSSEIIVRHFVGQEPLDQAEPAALIASIFGEGFVNNQSHSMAAE